MKDMTLRRIADACGGILHIGKDREYLADTEVSAIVTDSRQAGPGTLFAAICGERVDGHRFIPAVFGQGASCVLTEKDLGEDADGCWIKVISTLNALRDIAEEYLRIMNVPVVGITGSVGKTSTKEMIASVLSQRYRTLKTAGNFNNELGLPLTAFRLTEEDEIAVLEMGMNHFGEMHRLAKIARPDTCVITNIGQCHLEFLGSREGILQAKTEIFDYLRSDGHVILNGNDDMLCRIREVEGIRPVYFGFKGTGEGVADEELSVWADELEDKGLTGISCRIHSPAGSISVTIPVPGQHMVMNALAATAVGLTYGLTLEEIRAGIEAYQSVDGRFRLIQTGKLTIIDDCYNANPVSMKASLLNLKSASQRKIAILGDMGELGEEEEEMHRDVGRFAASCTLDHLIGVGTLAKALVESALEENPRLNTAWYENLDQLLEVLDGELREGDAVLVKASHFMQFQKIVEQLEKL